MLAIGIMLSLILMDLVLPVNMPTSISGSMANTYPRLWPISLIPLRPNDVRSPCQPFMLVCSGCVLLASPSDWFTSSVGSACCASSDCGLFCGFCSACFFFSCCVRLYSSSFPGAMIMGTSERSLSLSPTWVTSMSLPIHVAAVFKPPPNPPIQARSVTEPRAIPAFFSQTDGLYRFSASESIFCSNGDFATSCGR